MSLGYWNQYYRNTSVCLQQDFIPKACAELKTFQLRMEAQIFPICSQKAEFEEGKSTES